MNLKRMTKDVFRTREEYGRPFLDHEGVCLPRGEYLTGKMDRGKIIDFDAGQTQRIHEQNKRGEREVEGVARPKTKDVYKGVGRGRGRKLQKRGWHAAS